MTDTPLHHIRIVGIPVPVWRDTRDWFEGLMREFDIIASEEPTGAAPDRLLDFVAEAQERFSRFTSDDRSLDDALARGERQIDREIQLPEYAADAARRLWKLICEAEDYCRSGAMLTLVPSDEVRRFTHWYLTEIADQIDGRPPTPWDAASGE